jgi:hypothetical protein
MVTKAPHENIRERGQAPDQLMLLENHTGFASVFPPLARIS